MNPVKLALKPLTTPPKSARTVNLYKKRTLDPSRRFRIKIFGWEERPVRIVNTIAWILEHAKEQGLTPRKDGYVRVQDLLKHPNFVNLDFPTIEEAVQSFRHPYLRLTLTPGNASLGSNSAVGSGCWWIGLQQQWKYSKRTLENYVDRRIIDPQKASGMMYQIPSQDWPEISVRGIPRGRGSQLAFSNDFMIPFHYEGDNTFIHVDSKKVHARYPLYNTRTTNLRGGNKTKDTFTTPAPKIPPTMFKSAMRVAVEKYPLILRNPMVKKDKRKQMQNEKRMSGPPIIKVMQSGIDALRKYGFADVVEWLGLEAGLTGQEQKASAEQTEKSSDNAKDGPAIARPILLSPIAESSQKSLKDPPPPSPPVPSVPPHL